jgi:membrane fusion protein, multidrug efflux system
MNTLFTFSRISLIKRILIAFGVTLLFMLPLINLACTDSKAAAPPAAAPILIKTAPVEVQEIAEPVRASGILSGKEEARLSFKIGGIIDRIYVNEGESVRGGQLLARLKLSEINAEVTKAQNGFEKAERDLRRVKNLFNDSVTTLEQMQDATTGVEVAKSSLTIAKFNQQYASIYAPSSGKVLKRFMEENELVGVGTPILQLSDAARGFVVRVGLADKDVVRLSTGDRAEISLDAYPDAVFEATVSEIAGTSSPQTGTFDVELKLAPTSKKLMSGLIATAVIAPSATSRLSLIPISAFMEGDKRRGFVYTVSEERAKKMPVAVGFIIGDKLAVKTGLENANAVVTDGAAYLSNGAAVTIQP